MSINDISSCLKGGRSCGVGREEHASNLLWCEHCGIALCFDCDTDLHNSKNLKHGHLRVLLPASRTEAVRKCEHGADGSSNVHFGLITKNSPPKYTKGRASKKGKGALNSESGRRSSSSRIDGGDVEVGVVKVSDTSDLANSEKASSSSLKLPRSALRGSYENAGLGIRPKQHVTWHPDVKEPLCTIVSHTVGHKRAPAFLSRRSHQKQLRQKSKASSKSRAKKQESNKHKNSQPVNARTDVTSDFEEEPELELGSIDFAAPPTNQDPTDPMGRNCSNCSYCIQENRLCDCVNMTDGYLSDPSLQAVLLESAVHPVSHVNEAIKDVPTVNAADKKVPTFSNDDECLKESFSEEYRQLLASVVHAATSLGKNETLRSRANCEAASGLFRDVKMHASGTSLSGSEQVFNQSTQGKISPWISVV